MEERGPYSVVLCGATHVGKTTLYNRLGSPELELVVSPTVQVGYTELTLTEEDGGMIILALYDTPGQSNYRDMIPQFFRDAAVVLFMFDLTNLESAQELYEFYQLLENTNGVHGKILLTVGNKQDDKEHFCPEAQEMGKSFAQTHELLYIEISARTGYGISALLDAIRDSIDQIDDLSDNHASSIRLGDASHMTKEQRNCC